MLQSREQKDLQRYLIGNENLTMKNDEIEISLFGPGYGESVLINIGENNWIIIDSCVDPINHEPVPLTYLNKINVDPSIAVKQIIATHWHDDHIRGLSRVVDKCESAEFVCSLALSKNEFLNLVSAYESRSMMEVTGLNEFNKILTILLDRKGKKGFISPKYAIAERCLFKSKFHSNSCAIFALSPSDALIGLSQLELSKLIPGIGETKRRVPSFRPNHAAVVILIEIGDDSILLGSDLENTKDQRMGWEAIINSKTRPQRKASYFKIPHHGSGNADHPGVWECLLIDNPLSALTPFAHGKIKLPTKEDISRINTKTDKAYITGPLKVMKPLTRPKVVVKQIKEMGIEIRPIYWSFGHVRVRGRLKNNKLNWTIDLLNGAVELKNIMN